MFFTIDPDNGLAIYDQILRQVKFAVASGALQPGQRVPSLQELATTLALNPNTVARAYRDLQSEGILISIRGTGLAVAIGAVEKCRGDRLEMIRERLRHILREAVQNGITSKEVQELVRSEWATLQQEQPP